MSISFQEVTDAIEEAFRDISSLEVATLTNPVDKAITLGKKTSGENPSGENPSGEKEKITAGKVLETIRESLTEANLAAYTTYEIDGDSINFISQDESMAGLVKQHGELVKASIETRKAFFDSIVSTVSGLLK